MNLSLYEINAAIDSVLQLALDGEISDDDLALNLQLIEVSFDEKAVSVACGVKSLLAYAANLKAEKERLAARQARAEATAKKIKDYLSEQMRDAGKTKIDDPKVVISFRKSSRTVIDNMDLLPDHFIKTTVTEKSDLTAIAAAIKAGQTVPGAHIEERQNIQIK